MLVEISQFWNFESI